MVNQRPAEVTAAAEAAHALESLLARSPSVVLAAIGSDGRPADVPAFLAHRGHELLSGVRGLDAIVPEDQLAVIAAWKRAQSSPTVAVTARLLPQPDTAVSLHFFDLRAEHGLHVIAAEVDDPAKVRAFAEEMGPRADSVTSVRRDASGVFIAADPSVTAVLGWTPDDLIGKSTVDFVHPDDVERAIAAWIAMRSGAEPGRVQLRYRTPDGSHRWIEVTNENRLDDPIDACVLSELVDISAHMAEIEALRDRERLLRRMAEALPIGVCHLRHDGEVVYCNAPLLEHLGPVDSIDALIRSVDGVDRQPLAVALEHALRGEPVDIEVSVVRGLEERRCELSMRPMHSDNGVLDGVIVCCADVTDRSRLRVELEHRASHDALSGCLNRAATLSVLERALRERRQVTVAYIDLDNFKAVNDAYGHAAGDELLRVTAARLRSVTRSNDRIGRIGGDEFVVICPQGSGQFEAPALVARLTESISGDVTFARQRIRLSASIGAATSADGELDAEALLSRADEAMYSVKRRRHAGRPTASFAGSPHRLA